MTIDTLAIVLTLLVLLTVSVLAAFVFTRRKARVELPPAAEPPSAAPGEGERVGPLRLRRIAVAQRQEFTERWNVLQRRFDADPEGSLAGCDALAADIMRARGFPVADLDPSTADPAANHPSMVERYQRAHREFLEGQEVTSSPEVAGRMFQTYRALIEDLLELRPQTVTPQSRRRRAP